VFVPADKVDEFIGAAKAIVSARYPSIEGDDYTSIINDSAYQRLTDTLNDAIAKGAQAISLVENSVANETRRKFPPTALINVTADMQVMREEIFGPLLPIMTYTDMTQVLSYIQTHDRPLALYLFSDDKATQQTVVNKTRSGGVCINDSAVHVGQHDMPFGGVGESGMGQYHGVEGFFAMSKLRPIFTQARFPTLALLYPPYGRTFAGIIKLMIKFKA
jgi:coniferyl-aldehyde dehydrogenase